MQELDFTCRTCQSALTINIYSVRKYPNDFYLAKVVVKLEEPVSEHGAKGEIGNKLDQSQLLSGIEMVCPNCQTHFHNSWFLRQKISDP